MHPRSAHNPHRHPQRCLATALLATALLAVALVAYGDQRSARGSEPVRVVADQRLVVRTAAGTGMLALFASLPLAGDAAELEVERAVIIFHGLRRDADGYFRSAQDAAHAVPEETTRHALLIAPQFLDERDAEAHALASSVLGWHRASWESGAAARGPAPISSFDAIDALLATLADPRRFPNLRQVVLAGHSGGGQIVQRYAVVGRGAVGLESRGVKVRYVVANPSSYLYFNADRPQPDGSFAPPTTAAACPGYDRWKYGWADAPPYVQLSSHASDEARYAQRDVVYLLGTADNDPNHAALDKTCAGELEGPNRLARGLAYMRYLRQRQPHMAHVLHEVPGVGHNDRRMFTSACGLAALFDDPHSVAGCNG